MVHWLVFQKQLLLLVAKQSFVFLKISLPRIKKHYHHWISSFSLRSRGLEVVGTRKNGHARRRHARGEVAPSPLACFPRACPFSLSPTTSERLLRRLNWPPRVNIRLSKRMWGCAKKEKTSQGNYSRTSMCDQLT